MKTTLVETAMTSPIEATQVNMDLNNTNQETNVNTTEAENALKYVRPHELSHGADGYTPKPFKADSLNIVKSDKEAEHKLVSRDLIRTTGLNVRNAQGYDLDILIPSIKANGLNIPIRVYQEVDETDGNTYFYIIDGHRRFAAISQIGGSMLVRVAIVEKPSIEDLYIEQYHTSATAKAFTQLEIAMLCLELQVVCGFNNKKIATKLGIKEARVSSFLKLLENSNGAIVDMIAENKVNVATVQEVIDQIRIEDNVEKGKEVNPERVQEVLEAKIESGEITETGRKVRAKNGTSKTLISDKKLNKGNKTAPNPVADKDFETTLDFARFENWVNYVKSNDSTEIHPDINSKIEFMFRLLMAFSTRKNNKEIYDNLILGFPEPSLISLNTNSGTKHYQLGGNDEDETND